MQCKFVKKNNNQCEAEVLKGKDFCFFHSKDKKVKDKRIKANSEGGKRNAETQVSKSNQFSLKTMADVLILLEYTINNLLQGKMARERASCIGYLANITIGAIKDNSFEQRLEVIEYVIKQSKQA